jgi:hypothetical protein
MDAFLIISVYNVAPNRFEMVGRFALLLMLKY